MFHNHTLLNDRNHDQHKCAIKTSEYINLNLRQIIAGIVQETSYMYLKFGDGFVLLHSGTFE